MIIYTEINISIKQVRNAISLSFSRGFETHEAEVASRRHFGKAAADDASSDSESAVSDEDESNKKAGNVGGVFELAFQKSAARSDEDNDVSTSSSSKS